MSDTDSPSNFDDIDLGATLTGFRAGQKVFQRFTLRQMLGRGGMGVVWLAGDESLERDVALKFLPELVVRDRLAVADLKRETNRCLKLTHAHIVRVHDFVEDQARGLAAISMEYVDGDNLSNLRAEREHRCFEVEELRPWIKQLCEALDYAHTRAKMVHRDLKPANLMLTGDGELKVADFGVARSLVDSVSRVSAPVGAGTLVYMSPQQALGQFATVADDIYSLGATIYDLLTGRPPFFSGNIFEQVKSVAPTNVSQRRLELDVENGDPIPTEWEETIAACLAKNPADRPKSVLQVAAMIDPLLRAAEPPPMILERTAPAVPKPSGSAGGWQVAGTWVGSGIYKGSDGSSGVQTFTIHVSADEKSVTTTWAELQGAPFVSVAERRGDLLVWSFGQRKKGRDDVGEWLATCTLNNSGEFIRSTQYTRGPFQGGSGTVSCLLTRSSASRAPGNL